MATISASFGWKKEKSKANHPESNSYSLSASFFDPFKCPVTNLLMKKCAKHSIYSEQQNLVIVRQRYMTEYS